MRLNKYISDSGLCSRREADRLIADGRVTVNGEVAGLGVQVLSADKVTVSGKRISLKQEKTYLAYYKPRGVVCTFEKKEKNRLDLFFHYPERLTYAGRLDKNSEGLLILTNDGELINQMMRARNGHEKEYIVETDKRVTEDFLKRMRQGVYLPELNQRTRKCIVEKSGEKEFQIVLTQGLNRQIRRMCTVLGYSVLRLKRIRIVNVVLGNLEAGKYRKLAGDELKALKQSVMKEEAAR